MSEIDTLPKVWISAQELLEDSLRLARRVRDSGYVPTLLLGLWRGGAPVAVAVHQALEFHGLHCAHAPLLTSLYSGIDQRAPQLRIEGLDALLPRLGNGARILLVDDVFDTGTTIAGVIAAIHALPGGPREIRTATPWWKPGRNRTSLRPDYHLHESDDWLVFPHELEGLKAEEIRAARGEAFAAALLGPD